MKKRSYFLVSLILGAFIVLFGLVQPAWAHGEEETAELTNIPIGTYFLSVWSGPSMLRAGDIRFAAYVVDAQNKPVPNCNVQIELVPFDETQETILLKMRPATKETNFEHEIESKLDITGKYRVSVMVNDPQEEIGSANFEIEIIQVPLYFQVAMYLSITFVVLVGLFLFAKGLTLFGIWNPKSKLNRTHRRQTAIEQ